MRREYGVQAHACPARAVAPLLNLGHQALLQTLKLQTNLRLVGLAAQRLVRDDDRGSQQCGRRDAIEHILRDGDALERVLGVVPVVNRDRGPAQARVVARHRREHMRADRLVGIADRDRNLKGRIEHLAPVRPRLMRVAPYVKLLRRAADVDRDRLERELRLARRLGGSARTAPDGKTRPARRRSAEMITRIPIQVLSNSSSAKP